MRDRLRQRFSPTRHLRRNDGLETLVHGGNGHEWIVARELCAFTVLDATGIPAPKRRGYAANLVARWSPFEDSEYHVEWAGDAAMVWAWSRARVLGLPDEDADAELPRRIVPESLYRGQPLERGEQLLAMDRGFEGRAWRNRALVANEWWPAMPTLPEWNLFRRGAGLAPASAVPKVVASDLADAPWSAPRALGLAEIATRHGSTLAAAGVGLVVALLSLSLVAALALQVSLWQVEGEIAEQDEGLQRILAAREQAGRDADAIESFLAMRPPAGQVELLATVVDLLPASGWSLLEWRMPDPGTLEIDLSMPRSDPSALVQVWESSPRFEGVTVELGRRAGEVSIKARIVRLTPGVAAPAPGTGARG